MPLTLSQIELLNTAFRPHTPINDSNSFIGRQRELERVKEAIAQSGQQVVIYGERGAGKTSLANVATLGVKRVQVFCEEIADFAKIAKDIILEYQKIEPQRILYDAQNNRVTVDGAVLPLGNLDGNSLRRVLPTTEKICVILDELDRLKDPRVILQLGELAKNISTYQGNVTLIFVGVADTVSELLRGHISNFRNLKEIPLGRMSDLELTGIITHGEQVLGLKFSTEAINKIVLISDRLPYYIHLLATNAARAALEAGIAIVGGNHMNKAVEDSAQDSDHVLRTAYDHAILSVKGSQLYRQSLWALASLPENSHTVAQIATAANQISSDEGFSTVTVQAVGAALKILADIKKNHITSVKTAGFYSFTHPLMKGYVRLVMNSNGG